MNAQSYIDVRAKKLSATEEERVQWRELLQDLNNAQKRISNHEDIGTAYFGFDVVHSQDVPFIKSISDCPFRKSLRAFRALYSHDYPTKDDDQTCDLLISIVGFSLEPVMHTVLTLRPKKLLFIFSQESALSERRVPALSRIKSLIIGHGDGYSPEIDYKIIENTDTPHVFSAVRNAINQAASIKNVAIDITGGKKSMDASAFLAASLFEEISIYYVDYDSYDEDKGYPEWGSEYLNELDNPYMLFNIREEQLIKKYWDRGDFVAARRLIEMMTEALTPEMAKRYSLTKKRDKLVGIYRAAACYDAWSRFEYNIALAEKFKDYHDSVLEELCMCSTVFEIGSIATLKKAELVLELSVDRYMRGNDASGYKEWNRAALCYAQSVELLLRFCLLRDEVVINPNIKNIETLTLGRLKKLLFDDNPGYFSDKLLGERIKNYIADERNALSHFQCFSIDKIDYKGVMRMMRTVADELFAAFAKKFEIILPKIDEYKKRLLFCSLNDDLELFR